jgi:hypothetical protein
MQLGRSRLSQEERQRHFRQGLCMYCGEPGHMCTNCPNLQGKGRAHQEPEASWWSRCSLPVRLCWGPSKGSQVSLQALVDSGAAVYLMDQTLARLLQVPITHCETLRAAQALVGRPLGSGRLQFCTQPLQMLTLDTHLGRCVFFFIDTPQDLLV